jgi:hypothetical protein
MEGAKPAVSPELARYFRFRDFSSNLAMSSLRTPTCLPSYMTTTYTRAAYF